MKARPWLHTLALPVLWALAPLAHADAVVCPAETTWNVTTPLPDPWSSTVQASGKSKQFTALSHSVEGLVCQYSHAPGEPSVWTDTGWGFRVSLQRPMTYDKGFSNATCPA